MSRDQVSWCVMATLRRRLRVLATAWLMLQVAWLTALVPRDCCDAHRVAAKGCHESVTAPQCPMQAASGRPCPMHRGAQETPADCRLTGSCGGPMAAMFALLSNHGLLPSTATARPHADVRPVAAAVRGNLIDRFQPPDSPPPRA